MSHVRCFVAGVLAGAERHRDDMKQLGVAGGGVKLENARFDGLQGNKRDKMSGVGLSAFAAVRGAQR